MPPNKPNNMTHDMAAIKAASKLTAIITDAFLHLPAGPGAVIASAPAGSGKSTMEAKIGAACIQADFRTAMGAPTNEQVFSLLEKLHHICPPGVQIAWLGASDRTLPPYLAAISRIVKVTSAQANHCDLAVATIAKFADARHRGLAPFDKFIVDEAYQVDAGVYRYAGGVAEHQLTVGDEGQIATFGDFPESDRWRGLTTDPLQSVVALLRRNHSAKTQQFDLNLTWRLDARAHPIVSLFYPNLSFKAAVKAGARRLHLDRPRRTVNTRIARLDAVLDHAAHDGWGHLVLPEKIAGEADPEILMALADLVARLHGRNAVAYHESGIALPPRIAIIAAHNSQQEQLRATLQQRGFHDVAVDTANSMQGLEFDVVLVWHPLCGRVEADSFHADAGRLCVMLTRHRHACIVVGRANADRLFDEMPPSHPAWLNCDNDPILDGWAAHQAVLDALAPHEIALP